MHFNTVSVLLAAASVAQAGVAPRQYGNYTWSITGYQAGLSHGNPMAPTTSYYGFSITGGPHETIGMNAYVPPFSAHCSGSGGGYPLSSEFHACTITGDRSQAKHVAARIEPVEGSEAHIAITYSFYDNPNNHHVKYSGVAVSDWAREKPAYNMTITPELCK